MQYCKAWLILLLLVACFFAQNNITTEGGNVTEVLLNMTQDSIYWGGIVGNLNGSPVGDLNLSVSSQNVPNASIFYNQPNGSYASFFNSTLIVTRLPFKPDPSQIYSPSISDFNETGMFSGFAAFASMSNYSHYTESPYNTFLPFLNTTCYIYGTALPCFYIVLENNTRMGILKFDNGTAEEPLFVNTIESLLGYNGSYFDFEYLVPVLETYYFYIYDIDIPPYVQIISPANGAQYSTSSVPFTYIMTDDDSIASCWYVLDGVTTQMPTCGPAYILSGLRDGLHTLALYANDTTGNVGYDIVQFRITTAERPPEGGGTGIPYYQPVIPPPPFMQLTIIPEDIFITLNYAKDGEAGFTITSTIPLNDLYCYVRGDFENYTRVELDRTTIDANQTISGTIVVSMPATDILDYGDGAEGVLQCVGNATNTLLASTLANVYLIINKPSMELQENATIVIYQGEMLNYTFVVINKNNMTELQNLTVEPQKYRALFADKSITQKMAPGESGELSLIIKAPSDLTPGQYLVPISFYEHGEFVGSAMITLEVLERPLPLPVFCIVPDLVWTIIILLIGIISSILVFYRQKRKEEEEIVMFEKEAVKGTTEGAESVFGIVSTWIEQNKRPLLYAVLTMIVFVAIWLIIVYSLARCA